MDDKTVEGLLNRIALLEKSLGRTEVIEKSYEVVGYVTTTDATVTTLATIAIPASTTVKVSVFVVARRTGGASGTAEDGAGYQIDATYKNVAGTATLIGALTATYTAEDQAGWNATLTISGSNVLVRITGAAGNNVSWTCVANLLTISA